MSSFYNKKMKIKLNKIYKNWRKMKRGSVSMYTA